ncbi:MAG: hypothetical protein IT318_10970 [Anaerolineales bacterium]|nr:hypothetical protein [Anaerolineales bacterium]
MIARAALALPFAFGSPTRHARLHPSIGPTGSGNDLLAHGLPNTPGTLGLAALLLGG